jgi:hypothetical protein
MIDGLVRGPSLEATKAVCTQIVSVFVLAGIGDPGGLQQRGATVPTQLYTGRLPVHHIWRQGSSGPTTNRVRIRVMGFIHPSDP